MAASFGSLEFKSAFAAEFGYVEKWKGKKKNDSAPPQAADRTMISKISGVGKNSNIL